MTITKKQIKAYVDYIGRKTLQDSNEHASMKCLYSKIVSLGIINLGDKVERQRNAKLEYDAFSDEDKHELWVKYHSLVF